MLVDDLKLLRRATHRLELVLSGKSRTSEYRSREISLAKTGIQLGRMWLGKAIAEVETDDVYPLANNLETKEVEKPLDVSNGNISNIVIEDRIMQSKILRKIITEIIVEIEPSKSSNAILNACNHFTEARMWLGVDMGIVSGKED